MNMPSQTRLITIGFLLGTGVVTFLRSVIDDDDPKLYIAFTVFVLCMAGALIWYVTKTSQSNRPF